MKPLRAIFCASILSLNVLLQTPVHAEHEQIANAHYADQEANQILAGTYTADVVSENSAYDGEWTLTLTAGGRLLIRGKLYGKLTREYSGRYVAQGHRIRVDTTWCMASAIYDWSLSDAALTLGGVDSSCPREFILNNVWHKVEFAGIAS